MRCNILVSYIVVSVMAVGSLLSDLPALEAAGPRKESAAPARYRIPPSVLARPYKFAGETIPLNRRDVRDRIESEVNFLLLDARSVLTGWLKDVTRYAWLYDEILGKEKIPKDFILLTPILSRLGPQGNRSARYGRWALDKPCKDLEGTAMAVDSWRDDRQDPELATTCFARRIKKIRQEIGSPSWLLAAAAYVTSPKAIQGRMDAWKTKDIWALPLPDDSEEIISRWIALGIIYSHESDFGLVIKQAPPVTFDSVNGIVLTKDLPVAEMARLTNTPASRILDLNPKIKGSNGTIPAKSRGKYITHSLAVPTGKGWVLVKGLKSGGYLLKKKK